MSRPEESNLLMAFIGDDFTGSTDAMESLARHGIRTVLFTDFPTVEQLKRYPELRAFGVAGMTRSLPTDQIVQQIRPAFAAMRDSGAPIVHYKTCSTFDSSPTIGSIGRVIEIGMEEFASRFAPVIVGAPALGRYCAFGNLFARCGGDPEIFRLDRHPSMSRHPVTPMDEADLRRHLARQTHLPISLLDVLGLDLPVAESDRHLELLIGDGGKVVLIDVLYERHLSAIGSLLAKRAASDHPLFVVGSSGVESALCAHWVETEKVSGLVQFPQPVHAGPMIAVCGSCSPVTAGQIRWAIAHDFVEVAVIPAELSENPSRTRNRAVASAVAAIQKNKSVCIHTGGAQIPGPAAKDLPAIGTSLGQILGRVLQEAPVRRVVVAGGDTSSQVARALGIQAVEMIAELTRGAPLCKAAASDSHVDGLEITFKGGQIGNENFFGLVEHGPEFH
jgi:3-oxoisoapionate kinase